MYNNPPAEFLPTVSRNNRESLAETVIQQNVYRLSAKNNIF